MKLIFILILSSISQIVFAWETADCEGTIANRKAGLKEFGELVNSYILKNGSLPDLCNTRVLGVSDRTPIQLQNYLLCGSSIEGGVHYSCFLENREVDDKGGTVEISEVCTYYFSDKKVDCKNRKITTVYD